MGGVSARLVLRTQDYVRTANVLSDGLHRSIAQQSADYYHLKKRVAGTSASDLCPKHRISDATSSYNWRRKYHGLEVADAKWLTALEAENANLKKMLNQNLDG